MREFRDGWMYLTNMQRERETERERVIYIYTSENTHRHTSTYILLYIYTNTYETGSRNVSSVRLEFRNPDSGFPDVGICPIRGILRAVPFM